MIEYPNNTMGRLEHSKGAHSTSLQGGKSNEENISFVDFGGDLPGQYLDNIGRFPLLTSEQKIQYAKTFSCLEIAEYLRTDIQTGIREEKIKLTPPNDTSQKNPTLSKEVAENLLSNLNLAKKITLIFGDEEKDIKDSTRLTENQKEQRRAVIGYQWKKEIDSDDERENIINGIEKTIDDAKSAKEAMINHNLRFVLFIANRYKTDLPGEDRIQAGSIGLQRAVEKFDYRKGYEFSTYASNWVKKSIQKETFETARPIKFSDLLERSLEEAKKIFAEHEEIHGQTPTKDTTLNLMREKKLAISEDFITRATDMLYYGDMQNLASLDTPVSSKPDSNLLREYIIDKTSDHREATETKLAVQDALKELTDSERKILDLAYWSDLPQETIAKELGISVRKLSIEKKGIMKKLRKNEKLLLLNDEHIEPTNAYNESQNQQEEDLKKSLQNDAFTQIFPDTSSDE